VDWTVDDRSPDDGYSRSLVPERTGGARERERVREGGRERGREEERKRRGDPPESGMLHVPSSRLRPVLSCTVCVCMYILYSVCTLQSSLEVLT
jgi:hypothetical protein